MPPDELPGAVALNGVAVNIGRSVGPAVGGLLLAAVGAAAVFLTNAASFVGMLVVVFRWRPRVPERTLPVERLPHAMRTGLRYVRHSPPLQAVLVRTALFVFGASALFGLLPLVARYELGLGSAGFGLLLAMLGLGAIVGAALLPRLRARFPIDLLVAFGTIAAAAAILCLALVHLLAVAFPAMLLAGIAWITLLASLNVSAQTSSPRWVRARVLGSYLVVFQGGLALGSLTWGLVAETTSVSIALIAAASFLAAGLFAAPRFRLNRGEVQDLTPYRWPEPMVEGGPTDRDRGPVLVTVEYRVDPARATEFVAAMRDLGRTRRRDGAYRWGLFRDVADSRRFVETFLVESWLEHLRQHRRGTVADRELLDRIQSFHLGPEPPVVSHLLGEARLAGLLEPSPDRPPSRWRHPFRRI